MKNFDQFEISSNELNNIEGGTFCYGGTRLTINWYALKQAYLAVKPTCYTPTPTYCAPKPSTPTPTTPPVAVLPIIDNVTAY